ncbi:hypothetical protein IOD16_14090 [Saccharothrix sp. 6-C]|uniref:hypothetical protein n=1 Tax=Saccharothrix sp. 6-C TaxID=2781735 RepID=UPI001917418B|nr:hypothetical protein [Saccharothrix sp. 6-C]QQQ79430.1 hypothetical protein IOD16_14090 [Saccharothrix sp. 6-C]
MSWHPDRKKLKTRQLQDLTGAGSAGRRLQEKPASAWFVLSSDAVVDRMRQKFRRVAD